MVALKVLDTGTCACGYGKKGCLGRAGRVKEIQRLELGPVRKKRDSRVHRGGRNPRNGETLKEMVARESQANPKTPPPPRWKAVRTPGFRMTRAGSSGKDEIGRPRGRTPNKGEQTETRSWDVINTPDDQMSKKPIHGFVDGQMEECKSNGGTNAEGETGTAKGDAESKEARRRARTESTANG